MSGEVIAKFARSSIVSEYKKGSSKSSLYHTQQDLKKALLEALVKMGYIYRPDINDEKKLIENLRIRQENLNDKRLKGFKFSNNEWEEFFNGCLTGSNNWGIENRAKRIHGEEYQYELKRDDGSFDNIRLIDKLKPDNNFLQVIDNYEDKTGQTKDDLIILFNGLPMIQIEIKKKGISLKESFLEKNTHTSDSLHKLFEFIQIFVISNGIQTKYYSTTTKHAKQSSNKDSNSFLFTSFWSSSQNEKIEDLIDFSTSFLYPKVIKNIITKYCVFDSKGKLKVLRPYQVEAIERIRDRVKMSINLKSDNKESGGYIWHTTGSGKTLTSFKASQLLSEIKEVEKIMFVVDRKDLDHQTCKEYNNYEPGSVDHIRNSFQLHQKLTDPGKKDRIIITTIQKLSRLFGEKGRLKDIRFNEKFVIIMDECHRSQAGAMHLSITSHFKNASIFGFTGTPILDENVTNTQKIFGPELHNYKICNAIGDKNVLPFNYEYQGTRIIGSTELKSEHYERFRREKIARWIVKHFKNKTCQGNFNSIFATDSIASAIDYHRYFEQEIANQKENLKVAIIYSSGSDIREHIEEDAPEDAEHNPLDIEKLPQTHREYLEYSAKKYQEMFNTKIDISMGLDHYHADISEKMKEKKIDILIVVNMFLTGFDAPCLNTLWVDKNLREHGLIQAFSRTNRIYDDSKPFGNIVSFRNLGEELENAIQKFAGESNIVRAPSFNKIYKEYLALKESLEKDFPANTPDLDIKEEEEEVNFCKRFGEIIKLDNQLRHYTEFEDKEKINEEDFKIYKSKYLDIVDKISAARASGDTVLGELASGFDDINFEIEILDAQIIDTEYIQNLLNKIKNAQTEDEKNKAKANCLRTVKSDPSWRKIQDLMVEYVENEVEEKELMDYLKGEKDKELDKIIEEENLKRELTRKFMNEYFASDKETISWEGTKLRQIMPPMSLKSKREETIQKRNRVKEKLEKHYDRFKNRGI